MTLDIQQIEVNIWAPWSLITRTNFGSIRMRELLQIRYEVENALKGRVPKTDPRKTQRARALPVPQVRSQVRLRPHPAYT